jgi:hypothetical protein
VRLMTVEIQETGIKKSIWFQISHGRQERFLQVRVFLLDFTEQAADGLAHGSVPNTRRARSAHPETRRNGW